MIIVQRLWFWRICQSRTIIRKLRGEKRKERWPRGVACSTTGCFWRPRLRPSNRSAYRPVDLSTGRWCCAGWSYPMSQQCIDPIVGKILVGWRYDISGLAPEMRGDYESHFTECEYCRSRQE